MRTREGRKLMTRMGTGMQTMARRRWRRKRM